MVESSPPVTPGETTGVVRLLIETLVAVVVDRTVTAKFPILIPWLPYLWLGILAWLTRELLNTKPLRRLLGRTYSRFGERRPKVTYAIIFVLGGCLLYVYWWGLSRVFHEELRRGAVASMPDQAEGEPTVKRILLTPGSHPTPPTPACSGDPAKQFEIPSGDIAVFFGSCVAITRGIGVVIVNIDGEDVLSFKRGTGEMYLDAVIRDLHYEVVRIVQNVVTVVPGSGFEALNPDSQNLAVLDKGGRKVLSVRYVNPSAMVVSGVFWGKKSGPFVVIDGAPIGHGTTVIGGTCFEDFEGPLFPLSDPQFRTGR